MEVFEVSNEEYQKIIDANIVFNSAAFHKLNSGKADDVRYLIFKDTKNRFGLCVGGEGNSYKAPFSAPFALFEPVKANWALEQLETAVDCMVDFAKKERWKEIHLTLPPNFYAQDLITSTQNILLRKDFDLTHIDLNYAFDLSKSYADSYKEELPRNGRKNLNIALKSNLLFTHCSNNEQIKIAYEIIKANRESKGYPLRMSFSQVLDTIAFVPHDFFLVSLDEKNIAAAQVFYVTDSVAQVIYWGDIPGFSEVKPINYLAYQLIQFYGKKGLKFLDIGPSTENGIPNYGLCDFKTSIGCEISPKMQFVRTLDKS